MPQKKYPLLDILTSSVFEIVCCSIKQLGSSRKTVGKKVKEKKGKRKIKLKRKKKKRKKKKKKWGKRKKESRYQVRDEI